MLPNPPTPPHDYSSEPIPHLEAHTSLTASTSNSQHPQEPFATPVSNANMGLDDMDERSDQEERSDSQDMSDEDPFMYEQARQMHTMPMEHALALNAEMDSIDVDLIPPEVLADMAAEAHLYPDEEIYIPHHPYDYAMMSDPFPSHYFQEGTDGPGEYSDLAGEDVPMHGTNGSSDLPTTMSQVSLQLQQFHDGQEHGEEVDDLHGGFQDNNSISSILLPVYPTMLAAASTYGSSNPQVNYVSVPLHSFLTAAFAPELLPELLPAAVVMGFMPWWANPNSAGFADAFNEGMSDADDSEVGDQHNLSVGNFLHRWGFHSGQSQRRAPSLASLEQQRHAKLPAIHADDLRGDKCDMQAINWQDLGVRRVEAQHMRRSTYQNYTNLRYHERLWDPSLNGMKVPEQNFFRFRRMDFSHNIHLSHFQLRNLLACPSRDHLFYAGKSKVLHWNPTRQANGTRPTVAMNLTDPSVQPFNGFQGSGIQISTLTVAHNILVAGGFCGEYGLLNLRGAREQKHTEGIIIDHTNSITNHVQVSLSRQSALPRAVFASNDSGVRILDITTNKFVAEHMYDHAMNCSAISPDHRLRVLVGDTRQVMICNADTGEILQSLDGHHDYGFACDWADDGWTVATGNQDMQIKIWDARKWTRSDGHSNPLATLPAEMAGVRRLKFSPLGSGKRVLLAAEPADFISVIDAGTFRSKQTLSFFGEIGGVDFTNDGQDIWVANCDDMRGGLMEFERCGLADYGLYELEQEQTRTNRPNKRYIPPAGGYDWVSTDEELSSNLRAVGTHEQRERRGAFLGVNMDIF